MTREQQIEEAAHDWLAEKYGADDTKEVLELIKDDFKDGANWADYNPISRKIYSYYFVSDSGDTTHIISLTKYKNVYDFMKNEVKEEYDAWVEEFGSNGKDWSENNIPYETYDIIEYDT